MSAMPPPALRVPASLLSVLRLSGQRARGLVAQPVAGQALPPSARALPASGISRASLAIPTLILSLILSLLALPGPAMARASDVTIYRCTDARGRLTLSDSPCAPGHKQTVQTRLRPRDAAPAPRRSAAPVIPLRVETVRYVEQPAPRPLYACITPDGQRYTSESPDGSPRWMPLWALDAMPYPPAYPALRSGYGGALRYRDRHASIHIGAGRDVRVGTLPVGGAPVYPTPLYPTPLHPMPSWPAPAIAAAGTWVRDACSLLDRAETCAIMSDRRYEIERRYAQAMPSERALFDRESARLASRLRQECHP